MVTVTAPAKLNLYLEVGPLRADGYHQLRTLLTSLSLCDEVRAESAPELTVRLTGRHTAGVRADESNLAARAAVALAEAAGIAPAVALTVHKRIPVAAGLAGGSADAAATLLACDQLWQLDTPREQLLELAAELGSDVPFCLSGGAAVGTGRGELLREIPAPHPFHWVLLPDPDQLATSAVYRELDRLRELGGCGERDAQSGSDDAALTGVCDAVAAGEPKQVTPVLRNELTPAALALRPQLAQTLKSGYAAGALTGIVCGSGPTCALLTADASHAAEVAGRLEGAGQMPWGAPVVVSSGWDRPESF